MGWQRVIVERGRARGARARMKAERRSRCVRRSSWWRRHDPHASAAQPQWHRLSGGAAWTQPLGAFGHGAETNTERPHAGGTRLREPRSLASLLTPSLDGMTRKS